MLVLLQVQLLSTVAPFRRNPDAPESQLRGTAIELLGRLVVNPWLQVVFPINYSCQRYPLGICPVL